jgi:hypothetical protein
MELPSFVANVVNVQNNALMFAYSYYLDDIQQTPAQPVAVPTNQIPNLTNYFQQSNVANTVDSATLAQIRLVFQSFQVPAGSLLDLNTLVNQFASKVTAVAIPGSTLTSESSTVPAVSYAAVSSTNREPVIFEQSLPVMYFFVTCRHTYKQLTSVFEYNRAYFAGTQEISFLRHDYSTVSDDTLYLESGNDTFNTELSDFFVDSDLIWYTY